MKPSLAFLLCLPLLAQEVILLRPNVKPDATAAPEKVEERGTGGISDRSISGVTEPSLTVYLAPPGRATGAAIIVCPGGGYQHLAIDKEGHDVAHWLNSIGVTAFVLKYRLPGSERMRQSMGDLASAKDAARVAIDDATEAMRQVRAGASQWRLKPNRIGMMGFSAGGHLAAMMGMVAPPSERPDFQVLAYPAIPKTLAVTAETPRTFLVHADDDRLAAVDNSVRFYQALNAAKVPAELHVYVSGGHGFGIRRTGKTSAAWPQALAAWLQELPKD